MNTKGTTLKELHAWIHEDPAQTHVRGLSWILDNNPKGVYEVIQANWKGEFPKVFPGLEGNSFHQERMERFLLRKAEAAPDPNEFVRTVIEAVPYNPHATNWTKILP